MLEYHNDYIEFDLGSLSEESIKQINQFLDSYKVNREVYSDQVEISTIDVSNSVKISWSLFHFLLGLDSYKHELSSYDFENLRNASDQIKSVVSYTDSPLYLQKVVGINRGHNTLDIFLSKEDQKIKITSKKIGSFRVKTYDGDEHLLRPDQFECVTLVRKYNESNNENDKQVLLAKLDAHRGSYCQFEDSLGGIRYIFVNDIGFKTGSTVKGKLIARPILKSHFSSEVDEKICDGILTKRDLFSNSGIDIEGYERTRIIFGDRAKEVNKFIDKANQYSKEDNIEGFEETILKLTKLIGPEGVIPNSNFVSLSSQITEVILGKIPQDRFESNESSDWHYEGSDFIFVPNSEDIHVSLPKKISTYSECVKALNESENDNIVSLDLPLQEENKSQISFSRTEVQEVIDYFVKEYEIIIMSDTELNEIKSLLRNDESNFPTIMYLDDEVPKDSLQKSVKKYENKLKTNNKTLDINDINIIADDTFNSSSENQSFIISDFTMPRSIKSGVSPRPYQSEAIKLLISLFKKYANSDVDEFTSLNLKSGLLLADDMGLGKTFQSICFLEWVRQQNDNCDPILIIAPLSLIDTSWIEDGISSFVKRSYHCRSDQNNEVRRADIIKSSFIKDNFDQKNVEYLDYAYRLTEDLSAPIPDSVARRIKNLQLKLKNKILFLTYETLRSYKILLSHINFEIVILDEAQKIKNRSSSVHHAAVSLKSKFKLAMTGTPVENSPLDLFNLYRFVNPTIFSSKNEFKTEFPINNNSNPDDLTKRLLNRIKPHWLRRLKSDLGNDVLPEKKEFFKEAKLTSYQKDLYKRQISFLNSRASTGVPALQKLLSVCHGSWVNHNKSYCWSERQDYYNKCSKFKVLIEDIVLKVFNESYGDKLIIFVNNIRVQEALASFLNSWANEHDYEKVEFINGDLSISKRNKILNWFKNIPDCKSAILLLTPKACGAGLNLQNANHIVHYTREWNPALEDQATDRAYRIGQKKNVKVYFPYSVDSEFKTVEDTLKDLIRSKRKNNSLLSPSSQISFDELFNESERSRSQKSRVYAEDLDSIDHKKFEEQVVFFLFQKMNPKCEVIHNGGGSTEKGADILVIDRTNKKLDLIQVKHTTKESLVGSGAYAQVKHHLSYWQREYEDYRLSTTVVTNAKRVPQASANEDTTTIRYDELQSFLIKYPIEI